MEYDKKLERIRISQLAAILGIKKHTLNARIKSVFKDNELERSKGNHILLSPQQVKKIIYEDEILREKGKIIYVGNLKGGVGKTSIAYILISILKLLGYKVCGIDLDIQGNLTNQFIKIDDSNPVFFDIIENQVRVQDTIINLSSNLSIIPSSLKNSLMHKATSLEKPKHYITWFNSICLNYLRSTFDVIVVDTPPNLSTINSVFCLCLKNNDQILIPVSPDDFSIMGVKMFLQDIYEIRKSYDVVEDINISILMNKFSQNQTNNLQMLVKINDEYQDALSDMVIKEHSKLNELVNNRIDFTDIKKGNELYEIINSLLQEVKIIKHKPKD